MVQLYRRYLSGMYAFGLVETNFYDAAETYALKVHVKYL